MVFFLFNLKNKAQVKAEITEKLAQIIAVKTESFIDKYKFLLDKTFVKFPKEEKIKDKNGSRKKKNIKPIKIDKKIFS